MLESGIPTPSTAVFNDMRDSAIGIWSEYDNEFGYVDEKISRIRNIENFQDNIMLCYRMFDTINQAKMREIVSSDTLKYILSNL